ncbi:MAG TPA: SCO1664 family protein [Candidatus Limnocylindrales bacterium]
MATTGAEAQLRTAEIEIEGRLVEASNITLRVQLGGELKAVYKPVRGERPLWDFPVGTLAAREVAAYELSKALGWDLVPPTVMRDGPFGPGSCQLWLEDLVEPPVGFVPQPELPDGWLPVAGARDEDGAPYVLAHADDPRLARLALFDVVINNADRKGGHVLATPDSRIFGVDHGICFHTDDKLRTVLWGFHGRAVPDADLLALKRVNLSVLAEYLSTVELEALAGRIEKLQIFPEPPGDRYPIPWPPI